MTEQAKLLALLFLCVLGLCAPDPYEGNPFYIDQQNVNKGEFKWNMKLKNHHATSPPEDSMASATNAEILYADATFEVLDKRVMRFRMTDANTPRWEPPILNPDSGKKYQKIPIEQMGLKLFDEPFGFEIVDPETSELVVTLSKTTSSSLKFYDKYLEFGVHFSNKRIFGMGERVTPKFELCSDAKPFCVYTTFNRDEISPLDNGDPPGGKQDYGHQPFYMIQLKSGKFIGFLFLNSNAQDTVLVKGLQDTLNVYHKPIGGIFDYYMFYPGTADEVLKKYHELIGRPYVIPFWSLGFHLCRYGWPSLAVVESVVAKMEETDIPLEVVWADIDYMKDYADFTIDPVRYGGLGQFVQKIHGRGMRWVPIIDAGLKYDKNDPYYQKGEQNNAFIKSAVTGRTLIGKVWPGLAVFPDWYVPYATELWHDGLADLFGQAEFDGIWIDMNEVSNFCNGECLGEVPAPHLRSRATDEGEYIRTDPHDPKEFDMLPYYPGSQNPSDKTLSMTGYHRATNEYEDKYLKEYNVHSLWALFEARATHSFIANKLKKRPFILTRASFPGSGIYASKWLGDNFASWESMRYSIIGLYNENMYGIPLVGADMCGFVGDTTEELCARWMQMGAFYPFTRNHGAINAKPHEPYIWERVARASRNALRQKYSVLRYYYTKLFEVSLNGGSFMRPLFWEFPLDEKAYSKSEFMFMAGPALLVAPVLFEGMLKTYPYCPNENWFNMFSGEKLYQYDPSVQEGKQITLDAGFDYINVLLKGGNIIPFQDAIGAKARRTEILKIIPMEIIIAPDHNGIATGSLIVDEGDSLTPIEKGVYRYLKFDFSTQTRKLTVNVVQDFDKTYNFEKFSKLSIWGASKLADVKAACIVDTNGSRLHVDGFYDSTKEILSFMKQTTLMWKDISTIQFGKGC